MDSTCDADVVGPWPTLREIWAQVDVCLELHIRKFLKIVLMDGLAHVIIYYVDSSPLSSCEDSKDLPEELSLRLKH